MQHARVLKLLRLDSYAVVDVDDEISFDSVFPQQQSRNNILIQAPNCVMKET
jgi:hypothetical protein